MSVLFVIYLQVKVFKHKIRAISLHRIHQIIDLWLNFLMQLVLQAHVAVTKVAYLAVIEA